MGLENVSVLIAGVSKNRVMEETWGHLAPKKNKTYKGFILFALSEYGDDVILNAEFKSLDDSPWFYDTMQDFIFKQVLEKGVYKFEGTFRNYVFEGTIRKINTD